MTPIISTSNIIGEQHPGCGNRAILGVFQKLCGYSQAGDCKRAMPQSAQTRLICVPGAEHHRHQPHHRSRCRRLDQRASRHLQWHLGPGCRHSDIIQSGPQITAIRLKLRRVPIALKPKVNKQLDKLITQGIVEPVDHARWWTPIVRPIKSDGSVRICADYKYTNNKVFQQHAYQVPVVNHLLHSWRRARSSPNLTLPKRTSSCP